MTVNTEFLKEILAKRNWSMRKLAYKAGVSQATLSRVFNSKRGVGAKTFNAIGTGHVKCRKNGHVMSENSAA